MPIWVPAIYCRELWASARASELLYTGRSMDGPEAERWGFYNKLCEPAAVLADAQAAGEVAR